MWCESCGSSCKAFKWVIIMLFIAKEHCSALELHKNTLYTHRGILYIFFLMGTHSCFYWIEESIQLVLLFLSVCAFTTVQQIFSRAPASSAPSLWQPALVLQSPLLTCKMPNWTLINHSDVIRHNKSSAVKPCAYSVKMSQYSQQHIYY